MHERCQKSTIDLLVLDAHGVVLNTPFPKLLRHIAHDTGQSYDSVSDRWERIRLDFWTGRLTENSFWSELGGTGMDDGNRWRRWMERNVDRGPAAALLERWSRRVPIWILSNHRSDWLLPRLVRFGIDQYFEKVLVSDRLNSIKPQAASFAPLLSARPDAASILFVDDNRRNVETARRMGITSLHASRSGGWIRIVDDMFGDGHSSASRT